jgi:hypothetical protein
MITVLNLCRPVKRMRVPSIDMLAVRTTAQICCFRISTGNLHAALTTHTYGG